MDHLLRHLRRELEVIRPSCFTALPAELRALIMDWTAVICEKEKFSLAGCAAVNEEWRNFFEPLTFRSLKVTPTSLHLLDHLVRHRRRRQYVRHIWFRFERRFQPENWSFKFVEPANTQAFAAGLVYLFQILGKWMARDKCTSSISAQLLTLELSAFSGVDPNHSMKDSVSEDLENHDPDAYRDADIGIYKKSLGPLIPRGEARFSESDRMACYLAPSRIDAFSTTSPASSLTRVSVVNILVISRQPHSGFFAPFLKTIIEALPYLVSLNYEPWRKDGSDQEAESELLIEVLSVLPRFCSALVMFEDHPETYRGYHTPRVYTERCAALAQRLSLLSSVRHLCLSYIIDGKDFFAHFWTPSPPQSSHDWSKLETLTLTSNLIQSDSSPDAIAELILAAGRAAKHMPNLRSLEIYNVRDLEGGVFRFRVTDAATVVCWLSTWEFDLPAEAIKPWREMYERTRSQSFEVKVLWDEWLMEWPGCMLPCLYNRKLVVHPITHCHMMNGINRL